MWIACSHCACIELDSLDSRVDKSIDLITSSALLNNIRFREHYVYYISHLYRYLIFSVGFAHDDRQLPVLYHSRLFPDVFIDLIILEHDLCFVKIQQNVILFAG